MGFARDKAERALTAAKNKLDEAVGLLLSGAVDKPEADEKVAKLVALGFTETEAKNGLEMFGGVRARDKAETRSHMPAAGCEGCVG